jgi:hypothetical protein
MGTTVIDLSFKVLKIFDNLRFLISVTDHGDLAIKWCNDWAEFIPTTSLFLARISLEEPTEHPTLILVKLVPYWDDIALLTSWPVSLLTQKTMEYTWVQSVNNATPLTRSFCQKESLWLTTRGFLIRINPHRSVFKPSCYFEYSESALSLCHLVFLV